MSLVSLISERISSNRWVRPGQTALAAVSGGCDSMVLLDLLQQVAVADGWQLEVACVDHGLRPFDEERRLLEGWCGQKCVLHLLALEPNLPLRAGQCKASVEEQARVERYESLRELANQRGAVAVFLAHHANDQAETLLLNLLRGTGPAGLAGMPTVREGLFVRPLLDLPRQELRRWAHEHGVPFVEDPTNASLQYRRNQVRNVLIPSMEAIVPAAVPLLVRTARLARKEAEQKDALASSWLALCWRGQGRLPYLSVRLLARTPVPEWSVRKALTDFLGYPPSEATSDRVMELLAGTIGGEVPLGRGLRAVREGDELRWKGPVVALAEQVPAEQEPLASEVPSAEPQSVPGPGRYLFEGAQFQVTQLPWATNPDKEVQMPAYAGVLVSASAFPLLLDRWKPGERMSLWGFAGHRLVSDMLSEMGIPRSARAGWSVVRDRDGEIVWLCSVRRGASYPVAPTDSEAYLVELVTGS